MEESCFVCFYCRTLSLGYCLIVAIGLGRIVEFLAGYHHRSTAAVVISCRRMSSTAPAVLPQGRPVVTSPKRLKVLLLIGAILTASSFAAKTWTRNADWKDRKTLFRYVPISLWFRSKTFGWMDGWRKQGPVKVVTGMRAGCSFINDFFFYYLYDAWKELSVVVQRVDKTGVMGIKLGVPDCCSLPFL